MPTVFVIGLMALAWWTVHTLGKPGTVEDDGGPAEFSQPGTIVLPAGKLASGNFESAEATTHRVQHMHTVPGRIRYDDTKHIAVKAPLSGMIMEMKVTPGQTVEKSQLLAIVRSPEIGQARGEVLMRRKERGIAQQNLEREVLISQNLEKLTAMLYQETPIAKIEDDFADRPLGPYRQSILEAYAKMKLAGELLASVQPLASSGAISLRAVKERQGERQVAETSFRAARDTAEFGSRMAKLKAEADLAEADRQVELAWQGIESLLGYAIEKDDAATEDNAALSSLDVRAPFAGTIESRHFATGERVAQGEPMLTIANTDTLYVAASIRENDWPAVTLPPGTVVTVTIPALENQTMDATIKYIGREVLVDTNAVPLVATIANDNRLLRPGMFVRVALPIGEARETLAIKPEAVVQHENHQFVFVDLSGGKFKRVDVSTGEATKDWIEVTGGLSSGQRVVTHGAFLLKSELLLQGEVE